MGIPIEALEAEVLGLPAAERARLLDRVVASLDNDAQISREWDELAAQRDAEIERGQAQQVPLAAALERLRARVG